MTKTLLSLALAVSVMANLALLRRAPTEAPAPLPRVLPPVVPPPPTPAAVGQGAQGSARVRLTTAKLRELEGKSHELLFRCLGDAVTAALDGEDVFVEVEGQPRRGRIQFTGAGKSFRVLSLEMRELD